MIERFFKDGEFNDRSLRTMSDETRLELLKHGPSENVVEAIYWLKNNLTEYPKKCLSCQKPLTKFISFNKAYLNDFCSAKCSNSSKSVQEKKKEKSRELYGTDYPWQKEEIKEKIAAKQKLRNFERAPTIVEEIEQQGFKVIKWDAAKIDNPASLECSKGHKFLRQVEGWNRWFITCPKCSKTRSQAEINIENFIESLGFTTQQQGKRKLLSSGTEVDIFVPSKNLGIEFNGLFFHSTGTLKDKKAKLRHVEKQNDAEKCGIKLFQIWESEWNGKKEIVKSRIRHALGISTRIAARKCKIQTIDSKTAKEFLQANHIQGGCNSSVNLGLLFQDKLVALMTFGKPRFSKKAQWEMLRYCTILNTTVVGGPAKLLTKFKTEFDPESVISYADRRWSQGNLYTSLGFDLLHVSPPGYWYFNNAGLHHRLKFQKHKLHKELKVFDPDKTEEENMLLNGFRILWDCGNLTFIWKRSTKTSSQF